MGMSFRWRREHGASLVEYVLAIALIALIAVPAVNMLGTNVRCAFLGADTVEQSNTSDEDLVVITDCVRSASVSRP